MIDLLFFPDRLSEYIFWLPPVSFALSKHGTPLFATCKFCTKLFWTLFASFTLQEFIRLSILPWQAVWIHLLITAWFVCLVKIRHAVVCNLQVLYKVVLNFVCVFYFGWIFTPKSLYLTAVLQAFWRFVQFQLTFSKRSTTLSIFPYFLWTTLCCVKCQSLV